RWLWQLDPAAPALKSAASLQWRLRYWDGVEAKGEAAAVPGPGGIPFSFVPARLGWARLEARLVDAKGQVLLSEETSLDVGAPDRTPKRVFRYGFCSHYDWIKEPDRPLAVAALGASGVDIVRDVPDWSALEPQPGKWNFDVLDRFTAAVGAFGIEVQPMLGFSTQWGSTGDPTAKDWHQWGNKMPKLEPWLDYVRTMVARYGDRMHYWEVWNEPDHGFWLDTPENYLLLFNKTAEAIKQTNPSAKVLNGGLTFLDTPQDIAVRKALFTQGDRSKWDVFAFHCYMTLGQLLERTRQVREAMRAKGLEGMPVWLNESGFHTLVPDGERAQAMELVKKLSVSPALGFGAYFWYDLRDDGIDASTTEHRLGVVDYYFRPRPAFSAYRTLIRELASRTYFAPENAPEMPGPDPAGVWLHGYAGPQGGEHRLVAWREGGATAPVMLLWPEGAEMKGVIDLMGNPLESSRLGKYTAVNLGREPVYVAFSGKAAYPRVVRFLRMPSTIGALPGGAGTIDLGVANPTEEPLQMVLKGTLADGGGSLFEASVVLPSGAEKDLPLAVAWPQGLPPAGKVDLEIRFPSSGQVLHAALPYAAARVIPKTSADPASKAKAQIVLNRRENVVNLAEGLAQAERDWKGPDDLSATASLDYDDAALHLAIDVQDDVHFQDGNPFRLWEGDGVQLALKLGETAPGYLQLGLALSPAKGVVAWVDKAPSAGRIPVGALSGEAIRSVERQGTHTLYRLDLPWALLGSDGPPKEAFRFSFLVNDNDGNGRKQWIELSPGIGRQQDPALFPLFLCQ
ncbi:MAG TPA: hypothetical protein VIM58_02660, partial [Candidatus Methylacidiphilales bacterium]